MNDEERQGEAAVKHGQIDDESSFALESLLEMAHASGADIGPGEMMGRAIRLYYAVVTGRLIVAPSRELADMAAKAGLCEVPRRPN